MDITESTLTGISFCTGARGLEIGLERAGVNVRELCYVEVEIFVIANLVAAMEKGFLAPTPIWSNLKSFNPEPFRGMVDIFTAGYPCQPFSLAGKRAGEEDPRHLWPYLDNAIDIIRPGICLFENVAAHLTLGYETVRRRLQELGYHVEEGIYAAQEVGAPHRRERLFILAVKHGYDIRTLLGNSCNNERRLPEQCEWNKGTETIGASIPTGSFLENSHDAGSGASGYGIDPHWSQENERWQGQSLSGTGGPGTMVNSESINSRSGLCQDESLKHRAESADTSDVADSISQRLQGHRGHEHREGRQGVGENRPTPSCSLSPGGVGQKANSYDGRSREDRQPSELRTDSTEQPSIDCRGADPRESSQGQSRDRWPARPGEEQYDWEEPRTLTKKAESEVGLAINGYNFREDLLRLAGNAVVPQQAEYAFKDLIRKHREHNERK